MKTFHIRFLAISFSVVILLILGNSIYNYKQIAIFNGQVREIMTGDIPNLRMSDQLRFYLLERMSLIRSFLLSGEEEDKQNYELVNHQIDELFSSLKTHSALSPDYRYDFSKLSQANERIKRIISDEVFKTYETGNHDAAVQIFSEKAVPASDSIISRMQNIRSGDEEEIILDGEKIFRWGESLIFAITFLGLLLILVIVAIAAITSRLISGSFRKINDQNKLLENNAKKLEEKNSELFLAKEQLKNIFDNLDIVFWVFDSKFNLLQISPACYKMFGLHPQTFLEEPDLWGKLIDPLDLPVLIENLNLISQGSRLDSEYRIVHTSGNMRWVQSHMIPTFDDQGNVSSLTGFVIDITDRKNAEEERRKYEVDLTEARDLALEASAAKSQFLASMSHEIRTPLNAVIGMADILLNTKITFQQKKYLQILMRSSDSLLKLINGLLDLSKIESGHIMLQHSPFHIIELVEKTLEIMTIAAHKKNLSVNTDIPPELPTRMIGDPDRIRQILINLIGNAIKFTEKGNITVALKYENRGNFSGQFFFIISDTGIGIPGDKLKTIFNRFTQADSSITKKYEGSGLGLSISRDLAKLMNGEIYAESTIGEGSTFTFEVPLEIGPESDSAVLIPTMRYQFQEPRIPTPLKILLAEDHEENQLIIETMLSHTPYQLDMVDDGEKAVQKFKEKDYDLVLMDIQMPVMDGYTSTRTIRSWEIGAGKPPVPIIALTAHALKEDEIKSMEAGCNLHLTKPVLQNTLLNAISDLASNSQKAAANEKIVVPVNSNYAHLIPGYLEKRHQNISMIEKWLEQGNYDSIRILGHSLKGSGASYGLNRISEIGFAVEKAAAERDAVSITGKMKELENYLDNLMITYI